MISLFRRALFVALLILFALCTAASAEQIALEPVKDNTLFETEDGSLSNGQGENLFAGRTNSGLLRRALIAFDLSAVPVGSTVNSVSLTLTVNKTNNGNRDFSLHQVTRDWGEGTSVSVVQGGGGGANATTNDATWLHTFFNSQFWDNLGGDFIETPSGVAEVGSSGPQMWSSTPEMVDDVQGWIDNPSSNFGWIVIGGEDTNATARRFDSRESATPENRPTLVVDYTLPPELTERLYFPQFGNGDGFFSQITLINTDTSMDATVKVLIKKDDGTPFTVTLGETAAVDGELNLTIPASGMRVLRSDATGVVETGAVTVLSDKKLFGVIVFGGSFGLAGVGSSEDFSAGFLGPIEVNDLAGVNTGLAVQNLEDSSESLTVELVDADGTVLASDQLEIPGMGHRALFVTEFNWPDTIDLSSFNGTIRVSNQGSVAAVMIQVRPGQFATLPVVEK